MIEIEKHHFFAEIFLVQMLDICQGNVHLYFLCLARFGIPINGWKLGAGIFISIKIAKITSYCFLKFIHLGTD